MSFAAELKRQSPRLERLIVAGSIALLVGLSWWFLASGAGMRSMRPPLTALILMWWLMMAAMMLPSATPAILLYARVRRQRGRGARIAASWIFTAGYLAVWLLFSIVAAALQTMIAGPDMALRSAALAGAFLVAAGLYQLSPLKSSCLKQCRTPAEFLSRHWRPGSIGALRLGILHGTYCVGCCWLLMALLFVGGVMNLMGVIALAVLIAIEKLAPLGMMFARITGGVLIAGGIWRIAAA